MAASGANRKAEHKNHSWQVDFGAGSLKVRVEINEAGGLRSRVFIKPLASGFPDLPAKRPRSSPSQVLAENRTKARDINGLRAGFSGIFQIRQSSRRGRGKVDADHPIRSATERAVPGSAEVVWDYQIWVPAPGGELEVLLVAIKSEVVEGLFALRRKRSAGCNCATCRPRHCQRLSHNYGDLQGIARCCWTSAPRRAICSLREWQVSPASISWARIPSRGFGHEAKLKFEIDRTGKSAKASQPWRRLQEPESEQPGAIAKIRAAV